MKISMNRMRGMVRRVIHLATLGKQTQDLLAAKVELQKLIGELDTILERRKEVK